jgi:hypothetical protein
VARHYSPPGTFERIRKSVLEDPTFTNAEFRLVCYLATKPDGWVIHVDQLAAALGRTTYEIGRAVTGLRRRGLVEGKQARDERGRVGPRIDRFRRDLVVSEKPQVAAGDPESTPPGVNSGNSTKPQVRTAGRITAERSYRSAEFRPHREDGLGRDDGLVETTVKPSLSQAPRERPESRSLEDLLRDAVPDVSDEDAEEVTQTLRLREAGGQIRSARAYLRGVIKNGDALALVEEARAGVEENPYDMTPPWAQAETEPFYKDF